MSVLHRAFVEDEVWQLAVRFRRNKILNTAAKSLLSLSKLSVHTAA